MMLCHVYPRQSGQHVYVMHPQLPTPKLSTGLFAFFASANRSYFLTIAKPHNLAAELGSTQMADAYRNGTFQAEKWLADADSNAIHQLTDLRATLKKSTKITFGIAIVVAIALASFGKIDPNLPIDTGKLISALGALAAGWASVLQLHPVTPTYRRNFLHEVAHDGAVRFFFIGGVLLGAVGSLWWH